MNVTIEIPNPTDGSLVMGSLAVVLTAGENGTGVHFATNLQPMEFIAALELAKNKAIQAMWNN